MPHSKSLYQTNLDRRNRRCDRKGRSESSGPNKMIIPSLMLLQKPTHDRKQIRERWVNHLNPNINCLPFSRKDNLLLWESHKKFGNRWAEISKNSFNSSRINQHIQNCWNSASFKKFISNEFGPNAYSAVVAPAPAQAQAQAQAPAAKAKKKAKVSQS